MALTIDINPQLDIFRDSTAKNKCFDFDVTLVKSRISAFTKYSDELIPVLSGGSPGTAQVIDLTNWTTVRGIFVLSNLDTVAIVDFDDGNGSREIPLSKASASTSTTTTYCRWLQEFPALSALSFRNDNGVGNDSEVQFVLWGT